MSNYKEVEEFLRKEKAELARFEAISLALSVGCALVSAAALASYFLGWWTL